MQKQRTLVVLLSILLLNFAAYYSSFYHDFTFLDDQEQVVKNQNIQEISAQSLTAIFSSTFVGMYQPISSSIYAVVYGLFGSNAFGFHLFSWLFHALNICLLFLLLKKIKIQDSTNLLLTAIFAFHPMQVESVAWVSAFSNLVFCSFYLLALIQYLNFKSSSKTKYLWLSLLFYLLSCLSKSTAVSLPLVLLALDYFYDQKINLKAALQKIPFFILSILFGLITIYSREAAGHLSDLSVNFGWIDRIFLLSYSILFYPFKLLFPFELSAFYPYPNIENDFLPFIYYASTVVLATAIYLLYRKRAKKNIILGSLFFLFTIAPTLHFIPVGNQLTTDRYNYLPMIGLLLILAVVIQKLSVKTHHIGLIILSILFALLSYERSKVWENDKVLWSNVIAHYPTVAQAYNNLGSYLLLEGKKQEAFQNFDKAIQLKPYYADAYNNRGNLYSQANKTEEAISDFNKAIQLRPHADAYFNRANELSKRGNLELAIEDYSKSIALKASPDTYTNRAFAYLNLDKTAEAKSDLKQAVRLDPTYHPAYFLLAMEARKRLDFDEACIYLKQAAENGNEKAKVALPELCSNN